MKEIFKRYLVFVIGLYFLAAGIVLIIRSALGTTPISSINYVLSLNSPLSLGTCTFIINMVLILGQFWLIRKNRTRQDIIEILLQLPFSFIFSAFIDFNMMLTSELDQTTRYNEFIITTIRTVWGTPIEKLKQMFGNEMWEYCQRMAAPYLKNGKLEEHDGALRLTREGIFISDSIMSDLLWVD